MGSCCLIGAMAFEIVGMLTYRQCLREAQNGTVGNAYASEWKSKQRHCDSGTLHGRIQENKLRACTMKARRYTYTV
jgi:hypothetical protein